MNQEGYAVGARVVICTGEWSGHSAVVSWPIAPASPGYALLESNRRIAGLRVSVHDVEPPGGHVTGFTQLTSHLLQLSSHLIEHTFL